MNRIALFLFAVFIVVSTAQADDPDARTREVVRAVFSEVWSKGNVDLIPELFSKDYVGHFPGGETARGHEALAAQVTAHRSAFPDWTEEIEEEIYDGNRVAIRFRSRGTNKGSFMGNPPTGNHLEITEAVIFRLKDGKISEQWVYPDIVSMQRQLAP